MKIFITILLILLVKICLSQDAKTLYEEGLKLKTEKKYDQALEKFFKARVKEDSPELRYESGLCYINLKDYNSAVVVFKELRQIWPNEYDVYYYLGNSFINYTIANKYDSAINCFKKSLSLKPESYANYHELGYCYYSKGQYELAIENFNTYQSKFSGPYYYALHYYKGFCYNALKDFKNAEIELKKSIEIEENYFANVELGFANIKQNRNDEAIIYYKKANSISPNEILPYKEIANIFKGFKIYDSAFVWYSKGNKIRENDKSIIYGLGFCYSKKDDLNNAIINFNKVIELDKNYTNAYIELGVVQMKKQLYDEAILNFNKTIEINAALSNPYFYKGIIYITKKNKALALEMLAILNKIDSGRAKLLDEQISKMQ